MSVLTQVYVILRSSLAKELRLFCFPKFDKMNGPFSPKEDPVYSEDQLKQLLEEFRGLPSETEWIEFKQAKATFDTDSLGRYVSALSNEANLKKKPCAWLIFGIEDRPPRMVVGTSFRPNKASLDKLKHEIAEHTNGITFQEIFELVLPEGRVLMFQIPAAPASMPTSWKGHYYGRNGESLAPLSLHKLEIIRRQAGFDDWGAEVCPDATFADLEDEAVNVAIGRFSKKYHDSRFSSELDMGQKEKILEKIKLIRGEKITRAAILLLGKPESAVHLNPHPAQISWHLKDEEEAYEHFGPPFLLTVDDVFKRIRNVKFRFQASNQLIPIELSKYEPIIILEALNNCIAHQDYSKNSRILVTEYTDRIALQNAGGFYDGTVEDYVLEDRTPLHYRNLLLVQAMVNLDMIDTMGMGIRRMFLEQRKRYFPLPEYDVSDPNKVTVTIYGKILDENYSNLLFQQADLSLQDVLVLDRVQKKQVIDKAVAGQFRKRGLLEGRYPSLYVSAGVAAATNDKAQYIKNKAFDDDHYEELIKQFLLKYRSASKKEIEALLLNKLPEVLTQKQKISKIGNLLTRMRKNKLIKNIGGSAKKSKWALAE
jgi:ATP-dependent DNA helicase RecG